LHQDLNFYWHGCVFKHYTVYNFSCSDFWEYYIVYIKLAIVESLMLAPDQRYGTYYCQDGDEAHLTGGNC